MTIDPNTGEVTLQKDEFALIIDQIDNLSTLIMSQHSILKNGPVKYPELEDNQQNSEYYTNLGRLAFDLKDDFPQLKKHKLHSV